MDSKCRNGYQHENGIPQAKRQVSWQAYSRPVKDSVDLFALMPFRNPSLLPQLWIKLQGRLCF